MLLPIFLSVSLILICWLGGLTYLYWRLFSHYNNLTKGTSKVSLQAILDNVLRQTQAAKKDITMLTEQYATIEQQGKFHIQKIGLVRFNPFKDTGGDQSFILALLDGQQTGVVISGLYSRSGTRWYTKKILKGKGVEYELSDEEKKAIKEASVV